MQCNSSVEVLFFGIIVWMFYMMTFRPKQFMELNEHAKAEPEGRAATVPERPLASG